jgi:hypothetical protein
MPKESMNNSVPPDITLRQKSEEKIAKGEYDVFLSYNKKDRDRVIAIGEKLKDLGMAPWFDEWDLRPGLPWKSSLEKDVPNIKSAAIFIGEAGIGRWQRPEIEVFLDEFVNRGCPVIPVLLPNAPDKPELSPFLRTMTWVDFRRPDLNPMERLVWGITGKRISIR